jgi:hypothetical protein
VIHGALESIAVEMGVKLMRMSYSSIFRESEDFGAALVDATGRQLCETRQSTPLQSGPIAGYVRGILRQLGERGEGLAPGDVIMHNDAYAGASHGPDVAFCVPVFHAGALAGFSVTTAHHLDIGALTPGSCGIVDAVDAYAEGLQFKTPAPPPRSALCWHIFDSTQDMRWSAALRRGRVATRPQDGGRWVTCASRSAPTASGEREGSTSWMVSSWGDRT